MTDGDKQENTYSYQISYTMQKAIDRFEKKLDDNTSKTEQVLIQATKTNGRVNGLEQWSSDAKKLIESSIRSSNQYKRDRAIIYSLISFIVLLAPFIYTILQTNLKDQEYTEAKEAVADVLSSYEVNGK